MSNPNENPTQSACILIEQFRTKGYNCEELKEEDATIFVFTHEKRAATHPVNFLQEVSEAYKNSFRIN